MLNLMKKYTLELIVFLCGFVVMVLELDGSRILAPYLGTSLYVWTSIIGIILASLSLGYYLGGKLADQRPNYKKLSFIILLAAIFIAIIGIAKEPALAVIQKNIRDLRAGSVLACLLFFSLPNVLLGMVSPYAAKLKIESLEKSGRAVGNLYAISTLGSIIGTFLAGFFLIPNLGNTNILYFLSFVLVIAAIICSIKSFRFFKISILIIIVMAILVNILQANIKYNQGIIDIDSYYNRIIIKSSFDRATGRPIKVLSTDPFGYQSAIFTDQDNDLVFDYTKKYRLANYFKPDIKKALMIGGGAFTFPRDFLERNPDSEIDVAEIDPELTELAIEHFNFKTDPRLKIINEDGRTFLNKNIETYDAIYIDAFGSLVPPYQLTTKETLQSIFSHLSDDGVVMVNIISSFKGAKSQFLKAQYTTYKKYFHNVYLISDGRSEPEKAQNIMLIALKSNQIFDFKSENAEFNNYLNNKYKEDIPISFVLTDDYAPVENLMANVY